MKVDRLLMPIALLMLAAQCTWGDVVLTTLVSFDGTNGFRPQAPLIFGNDGNLYGTTSGGFYNNNPPFDNAFFFELVLGGTTTNVFTPIAFDEAGVHGGLAQRGYDGSFYVASATQVLKVMTNGNYNTLCSVAGNANGVTEGKDGMF